MARPIISDAFWKRIESLVPAPDHRELRRRSGRPPLDNRAALTGILFVLRTGLPWEELPVEMGCGAGMTCLRRLRAWQRDGVWAHIQPLLARELDAGGAIDWPRVEEERRFTPRRPRVEPAVAAVALVSPTVLPALPESRDESDARHSA